jgi:hypothetical protein
VADVRDRIESAHELAEAIGALTLPTLNAPEVASRLSASTGDGDVDAPLFLNQASQSVAEVVAALQGLETLAAAAETAGNARLAELTTGVQAALVAAGRSASDLNQFDAYARTAQYYESFLAAYQGKMEERRTATKRFNADLAERNALVETHRDAVIGVCAEVQSRFAGRVSVAVVAEGRRQPLESWILGLRNQGISRWWNGGGSQAATPTNLRGIVDALDNSDRPEALTQAKALGMSEAVAASLFEQLAPWARRLEVRALRSPDRYRIRWIEDGEAKDLEALSGGRRVAVLLALILESDDREPLFIDQPEDELDNRFLNETIIPALHRLKGKRQVVFATHNPNLVVNGDADQVIALEADARHGRIYASGAIEEETVRTAIVRTLDGGKEAFRLRREKYGY